MIYHHPYREPSSALYLITAPVNAVVSTEEMKQHLEVDDDDRDDQIEAYRDAATQHLDGRDGILRRALAEQTWELRMSGFPGCGFVRIPLPPLIEVVSVKYIDSSDAEQTFADTNYHVSGEGDRGWLSLRNGKCWPTLANGWPEPVIIQFRAGYIDGGVSPAAVNVPTPIVQAIKLLTEHWFENRSAVVIGQTAIVLPLAVESLLQPYRIFD